MAESDQYDNRPSRTLSDAPSQTTKFDEDMRGALVRTMHAIAVWFALLAACAPTSSERAAAVTGAAPQSPSSETCPTPSSETCASYRMGAQILRAAPGERVYRETWRGPFRGAMGHGSITLTIRRDGARTLRTPWRHGEYLLRPNELVDFEPALARSNFASLPVFNQVQQVCVDGVATTLEAIVDGNYRIAYFDYCGGVSSEGVAQALDQLFVFSAHLSGLSYPVNPSHPTFRG